MKKRFRHVVPTDTWDAEIRRALRYQRVLRRERELACIEMARVIAAEAATPPQTKLLAKLANSEKRRRVLVEKNIPENTVIKCSPHEVVTVLRATHGGVVGGAPGPARNDSRPPCVAKRIDKIDRIRLERWLQAVYRRWRGVNEAGHCPSASRCRLQRP